MWDARGKAGWAMWNARGESRLGDVEGSVDVRRARERVSRRGGRCLLSTALARRGGAKRGTLARRAATASQPFGRWWRPPADVRATLNKHEVRTPVGFGTRHISSSQTDPVPGGVPESQLTRRVKVLERMSSRSAGSGGALISAAILWAMLIVKPPVMSVPLADGMPCG